MKSINCGGKLLDLNRPRIMGILNITPDSFYDGGKYITQDIIHKKVVEYQKNGMDILDIGAYSSRPGAQEVSVEREKSRLYPY